MKIKKKKKFKWEKMPMSFSLVVTQLIYSFIFG